MDKKKELFFLKAYLFDRRLVIFLAFTTGIIFLAVGSLYQLSHLPKLFYAFLLAFFLWLFFGTADYIRYRRLRRGLLLSLKHPEQALMVLSEKDFSGAAEGSLKDQDFVKLCLLLLKEQQDMAARMAEKRSDMTDYYLLWAHQIKTPIAAMKLLLEDLEHSFLLREELFKIEQYVEMVLHYLRLESISSDMMLAEYDLHSLVKNCIRKYSVLFINSGLTLLLEEFSTTVLTDEKWLSFVLEQLLSNSIKYTRSGHVSIYLKPEDQRVLVIEDTGIGIRSEDLPRIFDRGFTGFNGRLHQKSTGIGLYLCRQILTRLAHGIRVESTVGQGTCVYLDLARDEAAVLSETGKVTNL